MKNKINKCPIELKYCHYTDNNNIIFRFSPYEQEITLNWVKKDDIEEIELNKFDLQDITDFINALKDFKNLSVKQGLI